MLYLHIGAHKTGTSSIQASLFSSRTVLAEQGVGYFGYSANHSQPLIWRFSSQRLNHPITVNARHSEADVNRIAAEVEHGLTSFLSDSSCPTKIISGEEISVFKREDLEQLLAFIKPFNIPVRIIVYVRNYYDFMNSQIQELVKWGWTVEDLETSIAHGDAVQPHYQWRIQKFIEMFGADNVDIRILHPDRLVQGNLLTDFCHAVGQPGLIDHIKPITANTAISDESVRLISEYNRLHPPRSKGRYNPARTETAKHFLMRKDGAKFQLRDPYLLELFTGRIQQDGTYMRGLIGTDADQYLLNTTLDGGEAVPAEPGRSAEFDPLMRAFGRLALEHESQKAASDLAFKLLGDKMQGPAAMAATQAAAKTIRVDSVARGLARALLRHGRVRLALVAAERATELDPAHPENQKLLKDTQKIIAKHHEPRAPASQPAPPGGIQN